MGIIIISHVFFDDLSYGIEISQIRYNLCRGALWKLPTLTIAFNVLASLNYCQCAIMRLCPKSKSVHVHVCTVHHLIVFGALFPL